MGYPWLESALWFALALGSSLLSRSLGLSVALVQVAIGASAGNVVGLTVTPWVSHLAGLGAMLLSCLAGTEVDARMLRRHFRPSSLIGGASFVAPFVAVLLFTHHLLGWSWPQAQIGAIALSTTSVAVVYMLMVETGLNRTELGKTIFAARFLNDLGTVLALGLVFVHVNLWLLSFGAATWAAMYLLARLPPRYFAQPKGMTGEAQVQLVTVVLLLLGGLGSMAGMEAVVPAYFVGMALAEAGQVHSETFERIKAIAFTILTPFYFLKVGLLISPGVALAAAGPIAALFGIKMLAKLSGVLPLTRALGLAPREGMFVTLLLSTGLTFGTVAASYGLAHEIIDQTQYTILVTVVIGSAIVPTLIAQRWFQPTLAAADGGAGPTGDRGSAEPGGA
jgi:Kef-type K+ transport system membrane component KefB